MPAPELISFGQGDACVFTARAPHKDGANQDSAILIPIDADTGVLAVADGMGGGSAGDQASRLAIEAIRDAVQKAVQEQGVVEGGLRAAILNGLERANAAVIALGVGAATTIVVAEMQKNHVRPYHVGDSNLLVCGQRGKVRLMTVAHSPVGYGVEAGLLDPDEAMHHEDRHVVSNMIGAADMRIEVGAKISMQPRDTLLMGTDGLFDNLHLEEIIEAIRKGALPKGMQALADFSRKRMAGEGNGQPSKSDDLTVIAYRRRP